MLDEATDDKLPALVNYVQAGIDYYYTAKLGMRWQNQGGNSPGKRIILAFTAALLDDAEMIAFSKTGIELGPPGYLGGPPGMHEDLGLSRGYGDTVLWGTPGNGADYWAVVTNGGASGNKMIGDPYGFIDGGSNPGSAYQDCCTTPIWKGEVLAALLMPEVSALWDRSHLIFEYTDRMEEVGLWAQPDPCAPLSQGGGDLGDGTCVLDPDLNPGSTLQSFSCQAGKLCGRFPEDHGMPGPGGSKLANEMWDAYRSNAGD
jgi:hypothetical protein